MTTNQRHTAVVCGLGASLPPVSLSNEDVVREGRLGVTDGWIRERTGIEYRRRVTPGISTGDLATAASRAATASAGGPPADAVLLATTTPDRHCPATAPEIAQRLGLGLVPAFDLAAVCSGFVYAVAVADALMATGLCQRPLVVAAETYSTITDPQDRDTAAIFGDGAGAVLLRRGDPTEAGALRAVDLGSDGARGDLIEIAAGGSRRPASTAREERRPWYLRMEGRVVFLHAVRRMTESARRALERADWPVDSVEAFIGHQANQRILDSVAEQIGIAPQRNFGNIRVVGNTAAASIPLAFAATASQAVVRPGARTVMTAFGGGLTWGSLALTWPAVQPCELGPELREDTRALTSVPRFIRSK
ncbi:beta-ketoacyl-ACP synthase 3 [Kitasatospora sp. NPDC059463]|uniref:beta-ketoacyl-ACP synthase 3 n=1 Tax=unclassified Kitasatospora TaxID=2633591 RepID=UPI003682796C